MFKTYHFRTGCQQDAALRQGLGLEQCTTGKGEGCVTKWVRKCLFLQLQDLSTRSGLSEGEAQDEAALSQRQLRDAGPDAQSDLGWFSYSSSPSWWETMDSQCQVTRVCSELLLLFSRNTTALLLE